MIELQKISEKDVYHFSINNTTSNEDIEAFADDLQKEVWNKKDLRLLCEFEAIPSLEQLGLLTANITIKLKAANVAGKYALMTNSYWIDLALPVGDSLTPEIPVKRFLLSEDEKALKWLMNDN